MGEGADIGQEARRLDARQAAVGTAWECADAARAAVSALFDHTQT